MNLHYNVSFTYITKHIFLKYCETFKLNIILFSQYQFLLVFFFTFTFIQKEFKSNFIKDKADHSESVKETATNRMIMLQLVSFLHSF